MEKQFGEKKTGNSVLLKKCIVWQLVFIRLKEHDNSVCLN